MNVKILGSVSPYCKDYKNCPGYLVTCGNEKVLLDCGPGVSRNMSMPNDLDGLTIVISHLHKDHYGDLLSLGYASYVFKNLGYLKKRIKVYIPFPNYYDERDCSIDSDGWSTSSPTKKVLADYTFLNDFGEEHYLEFIPYDENSNLKIGDMDFTFSKNPHQINTFSTRVVDKNNNCFVYSGDTGFVGNSLVTLAKDADLLLCEATFLRGQNRVGNNHLYAYEAAEIAREANVERLVLTHFFPEIDKKVYVDEAVEIFSNTIFADEGKVLKIGGR